MMAQRLIGDPVPWRRGKPYGGGIGILTRVELNMVLVVLKDAEAERSVHRSPCNGEDLWTAFVSLLAGGYISEVESVSPKYALTEKGREYLAHLTMTRARDCKGSKP
jgi:hypothetical protein